MSVLHLFASGSAWLLLPLPAVASPPVPDAAQICPEIGQYRLPSQRPYPPPRLPAAGRALGANWAVHTAPAHVRAVDDGRLHRTGNLPAHSSVACSAHATRRHRPLLGSAERGPAPDGSAGRGPR